MTEMVLVCLFKDFA